MSEIKTNKNPKFGYHKRNKRPNRDTAPAPAREKKNLPYESPVIDIPDSMLPMPSDEELREQVKKESENVSDFVAVVQEPVLQTYEIVGVKFDNSEKIYYFCPQGTKYVLGNHVIVETTRGLEFGEITIENKTVTEREVILPLRNVVRLANDEDEKHYAENAVKEKEALEECQKLVDKHELPMKLVEAEYTFDNSKLLFYFTSDTRVDFRELVKDLAAIFKTRIELRQIGIRDEAKMMGGLGICGRAFCCKTFLNDCGQVSMKMAKEQNLSLNSVKISGTCGRLMCCLKFEHETYEEEIRLTPKVDSLVRTADGDGVVVEAAPLTGMIKVRLSASPDAPLKQYHRDDVKSIGYVKREKAEAEVKR